MNSKNSKTSDPHRLLLNLADKINLKRSDKYVALSNLSICYTWTGKKSRTKTIHLKYLHQRGMIKMNYLMYHILCQMFKIILSKLSKQTRNSDR